jgi:hypothetical protein
MVQPSALAKAELRELNADFSAKSDTDHRVVVQFNPETLKVSFSNQVVPPKGGADQSGSAPFLFVGAGTTNLSVQLWFDATAEQAGERVDDVRRLTEKVAYFITPRVDGTTFKPPAVQFVWGTFIFDGIVTSMEESLEFFSRDGRPLRACVTLALVQQKITAYQFGAAGQSGAGAVGIDALTPAQQGATLQGMAAALGRGDRWKEIAEANGIENPRRLEPGTLLDMRLPRR